MLKRKVYQYTVIYKAEPEGGYTAFVPFLPGCHTQGETLEETEKNLKEAIEVYLESLHAHGEDAPREDKVFHGTVEVGATV